MTPFLPSDVIICSYPKSGTTWLQYILFLLMWPAPLRGRLSTLVPSVDHDRPFSTIGLYKTHHHASTYPGTRIIYALRSPLDVCVSQYYHLVRLNGGVTDKHVAEFCTGTAGRFGGWKEHVQDALATPGLLVVRYEDLIDDPADQIDRLAEHLKIPLSMTRLTEIVKLTSFEAMKQDGDRLAPVSGKRFFRTGKAGSHVYELTQQQRWQILDYAGDLA